VTIGAVAGTTTVMLTSMLGQIRIFYVMARDRMLPPWVAAIDPRTRTPLVTTLVTGGVVALLAAAVPLDVLLAMVNIGTLSAFTIVCLGVLALRIREPDLERPFRAPFGPAVAVLGAGLCLVMMVGGLSGATWLRFVLWFLAGITIYAAYGYRRSKLRG
jgi:APA family basic amino acid/polyamine antiporter